MFLQNFQHLMSPSVILACSLVCGGSYADGQDSSAPIPSNDSVESGAEADDLDALLDLVEEDFGRVAKVNVTAPALNVEVTTVSRKASTVGRSAAAVFVISSDMIRRSGATTVPDVLRMAPGVQVARITAHQWAISIRGFNGLYSNRLQVQVDGRSIYTPLFGGVIWGNQDVPLTEIERIEIIRGPGASVWGANAVNGIINIITRNSKTTQGLLLQAGTGTVERGMGTARYGTELTEGLFARVYGSWTDQDRLAAGSDGTPDDYRFGRVGVRIDDDRFIDDRFTFSADYYSSVSGVTSAAPNFSAAPFVTRGDGDGKNDGFNALWKWEHDFSEDTKSSFRVFYDHNNIQAAPLNTDPGLTSEIDIFDVDHQLQHQLNERHSIVTGLSYKHVSSRSIGVPGFITFAQTRRNFDMVSAFLQDEITLVNEKSWLTLGAKVSDNSFSGFEIQPTARILWLPDEKHSVWMAASRAVRLPTFFEVDGTITLPAISTSPVAVFPQQSPAAQLEGFNLTAFEFGIRGQPLESFSWDLTTFINRYENTGESELQGLVPITAGAFLAVQPRGNEGSAEAYGAELAGVWDLNEQVKIRGAYTYTSIHGVTTSISRTPVNQLYVQTSMDVSKTVEADMTWRYVDSVADVVQHYNVMDLRLAWIPSSEFEWSVVARNLFDDKHPEFGVPPTGGVFTQVPTSVYSMITWQY
ncbi:MAG: TonB-dependent receptor [Fuerstiella sp.]